MSEAPTMTPGRVATMSQAATQPLVATPAVPAPAQPRTGSTKAPSAIQATQKMEMQPQQHLPGPPKPQRDRSGELPDNWDIQAHGEPFSYREGALVHVMVSAKTIAALQRGYVDPVAAEAATKFGIAGKPGIVSDVRPNFPIDPETFQKIERPIPGCRWARYVSLTSR